MTIVDNAQTGTAVVKLSSIEEKAARVLRGRGGGS
jgi:hypothetical protein